VATKVLLVDDEPKIIEITRKFLVTEGFSVVPAYDGPSALQAFRDKSPDIVVLDVMLPGIDGLEVLKKIRDESATPVIMLTARSEEIDRLLGLGLGADDYMTKPFSLRELALRIRAILRRTETPAVARKITLGSLAIDEDRMEASVGGKPVGLTRAEFQILQTMLSRPGRVFTREELLNAAFGQAYEGYERTIDTHIWNIRRKIERDPSDPRYVITVFGVGYKAGDGR
jgi:two-component system OmpR family response regulator